MLLTSEDINQKKDTKRPECKKFCDYYAVLLNRISEK